MEFSFSRHSQGLSALSQFTPFTAAVQHEPAGKHRCSDTLLMARFLNSTQLDPMPYILKKARLPADESANCVSRLQH